LFLSFLSTSSVLFLVEFGIKKTHFPFFQGSILISFVIASISCTPVTNCLGISRIKKIGLLITGIGAVSFSLFTFLTLENFYLLTLGVVFYTFGFMWVQGPYFAECMVLLPDKGVMASLLTSVRLLSLRL
tara:strand:+ start:858 stop:1247 length:390 start_codon:yes stop_codon:yes gene_type:complete